MARIFMNQVGFTPDSSKKAVLDFGGTEFRLKFGGPKPLVI